eukprot:scaffold8831_cov135-Isochrysis_galbana.AAC.6
MPASLESSAQYLTRLISTRSQSTLTPHPRIRPPPRRRARAWQWVRSPARLPIDAQRREAVGLVRLGAGGVLQVVLDGGRRDDIADVLRLQLVLRIERWARARAGGGRLFKG